MSLSRYGVILRNGAPRPKLTGVKLRRMRAFWRAQGRSAAPLSGQEHVVPSPRRRPFGLPFRVLSVSVLTLSAASCGSSESPTQTTTDPPAAVATSINLSTATVALIESETTQLSATVQDQTGATMAGAAVTWASSAEAVATVSASGLVTAVGGGSATITANSGAASRTAAVSVEALAPAAVAVSPPTVTLLEGETSQLTALVSDQLGNEFTGASIEWASDDPGIATVVDGLVTAVSQGEVTVSATTGSVSGRAAIAVDDGPGPWTIDTQLNLVPVPLGESVTVPVFAVDVDTQESVAFTASGGNACVSLSQTATGVVLTGLGGELDCEASITITAEDQTKVIRAKTYVPYLFPLGDGLYMAYANDFQRVFGVGASTNGYAWHPNVAAPYFPVGSHFTTDSTDPATLDNVPAILLLDRSPGGNALAAPTSYQAIWTNYKTDDCVFTNCGRGVSAVLWRPVCPAGFKSLGSVATTNLIQPSTDMVRCVADRYTVPAESRDVEVWRDAGSGADLDGLVYRPITPVSASARTDEKTTMYARSHVACRGGGAPICDEADFNLLLVPIPVVMEGSNQRKVVLTDPAGLQPQQKGVSRFRVPFTLVPSEDPTCGTAECGTAADRVAANMVNPFVYVEKYDAWTGITAPLDCTECVANATVTANYTEIFEISRASSFSQTLGLSVTVGADAKFLGTGGSVEVTVSTEFGWTETTSRTYGTSSGQEYSFAVAPGTVGQIVQVRTLFRAINEAGQVIGEPFSANSRDLVRYVSWSP